MFRALKRWWRYLGAKVNSSLDERADLGVQLEQAIGEATDQHRRLRDQAATVMANQKQVELRLNRSLDEYEKVTGNARQALRLADEASAAGDAGRAADYQQAAEAFALRMVELEGLIEADKDLAIQAAGASEAARRAVEANARALEQKLAERDKLRNQLDQARLQEQVNTAVASLNATVGTDTPSIDEVRSRIEARYAKARSMAELDQGAPSFAMAEVEDARRRELANSRLEALRSGDRPQHLSGGPAPKEIGVDSEGTTAGSGGNDDEIVGTDDPGVDVGR